jgi:hypothetical protein
VMTWLTVDGARGEALFASGAAAVGRTGRRKRDRGDQPHRAPGRQHRRLQQIIKDRLVAALKTTARWPGAGPRAMRGRTVRYPGNPRRRQS